MCCVVAARKRMLITKRHYFLADSGLGSRPWIPLRIKMYKNKVCGDLEIHFVSLTHAFSFSNTPTVSVQEPKDLTPRWCKQTTGLCLQNSFYTWLQGILKSQALIASLPNSKSSNDFHCPKIIFWALKAQPVFLVSPPTFSTSWPVLWLWAMISHSWQCFSI